METCTPRSKRSPRRSLEDGSEGDAGQGVWEWKRESVITLHGPHGTRARDGPTRRTHGRHLARLRRRTNRCLHMRDTKVAKRRDVIRFKFRMFHTTKLAARREKTAAVPSGNGRVKAACELSIRTLIRSLRPPTRAASRVERDAPPRTCTEAAAPGRAEDRESPERD